jgi:hypothetical protein
MKSLGSLLILSALAVSCTQKAVEPSQDSKKLASQFDTKAPTTKPSPAPPSNPPLQPSDDSITIPTNIAGSYLTCALRKEATDTSLEAEIGCLLSEKAGGKKLATDAKLTFSNSQPDRVISEPQPDASIYHVLYRVKGDSRDAILQITQSLEVIALYSAKAFRTERISKILKPAIALDDYEAPIVREQAIDRDEGGSL